MMILQQTEPIMLTNHQVFPESIVIRLRLSDWPMTITISLVDGFT